ncbi:MAG: DUF1911 domain-containing protein [Saprospiraceae bacterium]
MRDNFENSKKYFELFIEEKMNLIGDSYKRIDSGILTEDQMPFAKYTIFLFSLEILIAKYSAGFSIDELKGDYSNTINLLTSGWDDSVVKLKMGVKTLDQYILNQYCYMVWVLSLGILLLVSDKEKSLLKSIITNGNIKDELILFLLEALTNNNLKTEKIKTTYKPFKNLLKNNKLYEINRSDVKKYLSGWFKNSKLLPWYNTKSSIGKGSKYYYGFWSFESAAIVAINGLDDASFRENEYYPKDLVDYYRNQV